jgi:hypothetical protein
VWLQLDEEQRAYLVKSFLVDTKRFKDIKLIDCSPEFGDPLYAATAKNIA